MTASVLDIKLHKGEHITWVRQNPPPPLAFPLARIAKRQECKNFQPGLWVLEPTPKKRRMRDTHYRGEGAFVVEKKRRMRDTHYRGKGAFVVEKKLQMRDTHYRGEGAFVVEKKRRMRDTHYRGKGAFVVEKKLRMRDTHYRGEGSKLLSTLASMIIPGIRSSWRKSRGRLACWENCLGSGRQFYHFAKFKCLLGLDLGLKVNMWLNHDSNLTYWLAY